MQKKRKDMCCVEMVGCGYELATTRIMKKQHNYIVSLWLWGGKFDR